MSLNILFLLSPFPSLSPHLNLGFPRNRPWDKRWSQGHSSRGVGIGSRERKSLWWVHCQSSHHSGAKFWGDSVSRERTHASESTYSRGEGAVIHEFPLVRGGGLISHLGRGQGRGWSVCINSSKGDSATGESCQENKHRYWEFLWQEICFYIILYFFQAFVCLFKHDVSLGI